MPSKIEQYLTASNSNDTIKKIEPLINICLFDSNKENVNKAYQLLLEIDVQLAKEVLALRNGQSLYYEEKISLFHRIKNKTKDLFMKIFSKDKQDES